MSSVVAMRRTLPVIIAAIVLLAACGSDSTGAGTSDVTDSSEITDSNEPATSDDTVGSDPVGTDPAVTTNPNKPTVETPEEIPTELVVTVIEPGSGPESQAGDTVVVDYVGVRSSDGVEFDNSYDRGQPLDVVVGTKSVIQGWDDGLIGVQAGSRIRLDIPSDLAYGEKSNGELIGENEALTFVIDVRAVSPPLEEPTETGVDPSEGATEITTVDLREGEGAELQLGQTAIMRYVLFRGDNGVLLDSSWERNTVPFPLQEGSFPVLTEGLEGMKVGGRRAISFPPAYPDFGFGPEGNPTSGLPAATDVVIVVDLLGAYDTPA